MSLDGFPGRPLTEQERRPLIDADGRRLLNSLIEHAAAPRYNHTCGDRLTASGLAAVRALATLTASTPPARPGVRPTWLDPFAARCRRSVPLYRRHGSSPLRFEDLPTVCRADLEAEPWAFVPDDHPLDEMVVYTTTGTSTGKQAYIASSPVAASAYLVMIDAALATRGLQLRGGPGTTAVALVCWQGSTYTYASVSSLLDQAAVVKLNLNPAEWRRPEDVAAFLDALAPEVYTGDPVAFTHLAALPLRTQPKALLSSAMTLTAGLQARLEQHFGCPVLDVYGMNESGPVAVRSPDGSCHWPLQPQLHIEVLDEAGRPCPPGCAGEITLTGGFNPAMPLLRYRTGDRAALAARGDRLVLEGLEGRAYVAFESADARAVNTIDVTVALSALPLARYRVHQARDRSLDVAIEPDDATLRADVGDALAKVFGALPLTVRSLAGAPEAPTYSSDLEDR